MAEFADFGAFFFWLGRGGTFDRFAKVSKKLGKSPKMGGGFRGDPPEDCQSIRGFNVYVTMRKTSSLFGLPRAIETS